MNNFRKISSACVSITGIVLLVMVSVWRADSSTIPVIPLDKQSYLFTGKTPDGWGWSTAPWNGNDAPYAQIRASIDASLASGTDPIDLYSSYRARALASPDDPTAQFGRAYAAWKVDTHIDNMLVHWGVLEDALDGLDRIRFPQTFNTVRIRFLIQSTLSDVPELMGLAQRIYEADKSDYDDKCGFTAALMGSCTRENEKNVVSPLIAQLKSSFPKESYPYFLEGYLYTDLMLKANHFEASDTTSALDALTKYRQMAPKGWYLTSMAQDMIEGLEQTRANNYQIVTH